jgi:hypothetical protein
MAARRNPGIVWWAFEEIQRVVKGHRQETKLAHSGDGYLQEFGIAEASAAETFELQRQLVQKKQVLLRTPRRGGCVLFKVARQYFDLESLNVWIGWPGGIGAEDPSPESSHPDCSLINPKAESDCLPWPRLAGCHLC